MHVLTHCKINLLLFVEQSDILSEKIGHVANLLSRSLE